jgi:nitrogen-specific signal transduction histidine kinase
VDIHALLATNLECAAQMAETHKILFESFVDPAIPPWLSVDAIRLQQIFNNFISNAFKFTPKGGRIRVEVWRVLFANSFFSFFLALSPSRLSPLPLLTLSFYTRCAQSNFFEALTRSQWPTPFPFHSPVATLS